MWAYLVALVGLIAGSYFQQPSLWSFLKNPHESSINQLLSSASQHPLYSDYSPLVFKNLSRMPLLNKDRLYNFMQTVVSDPQLFQRAYLSMSGGTTGRSTFFVADMAENQRQREALGRLAGATGITGRSNVAAIMHSSSVMYRALDLVGSLVELGGGASLPFTSDISDAEAFAYSKQFFVTTLHGSPTRLVGLAKYLHKEKKELSYVKQIVYGGEHLTDSQLQFLRGVFGEDLWVSSFLASAEVGPYGIQPPWLPRGHFIVDMAVTWIEILDADEDDFGSVALTNLVRKRIPLVRYDSGDIGRLISTQPKTLNWIKEYYNITSKESYFSDESTAQWSSTTRYTVLEFKGRNTKKSFQFWTSYYPLERFISPLSKVPGILQFQILLEQRSMQDYMTVLVVPEESEKKKQLEDKIKQALEYSFGDSAYLNICRVLFTSLDNLTKGKRGGKVLPLVDTRI